jgi:hypothetical protein
MASMGGKMIISNSNCCVSSIAFGMTWNSCHLRPTNVYCFGKFHMLLSFWKK